MITSASKTFRIKASVLRYQLYITLHPPVTDLLILVTVQQEIRWPTASNLKQIDCSTRNHVQIITTKFYLDYIQLTALNPFFNISKWDHMIFRDKWGPIRLKNPWYWKVSKGETDQKEYTWNTLSFQSEWEVTPVSTLLF